MSFRKSIKKHKWFFIAVAAVIFLFVFFLEVGNKKEILAPAPKPLKVFDYSSISDITAKSYCVYDILAGRIIFSKDEHERLPLASITKLMTALVAKENLPSDTIVKINLDAIKEEGDSGLLVGEKWNLKNLTAFSLMTSSNDGVKAIADVLTAYNLENSTSSENTISLMNKKAGEISLKDTTFMNETGLDINSGLSGAYSSAYDVTQLLAYIIKNKPDLIFDTALARKVYISDDQIKHNAVNTDTSINKIPDILASKTGFTDLAGGNLAVVFDAGFMHPVAVVALGSTEDGRFTDVETLVKLSLQKLSE
jgi:D-alanyl-D-alanine carboxypeptidase